MDADNVDHFTTYTHIKSFCCIPETNVICQLYPNFNKSVLFGMIFVCILGLH